MKITMIGASLEQNGGIATLEKLMLKHCPPNLEIQHITSHDEGSVIHRLIVFSRAWSTLLWTLVMEKPDLVHIHISDGGSLLRKALLSLTVSVFRKPVVMHANGAEFHVTFEALPPLMRWLLSQVFCKSGGFIAVTNLWHDYYSANLGLSDQRLFVLPNPTELPDRIPDRLNVQKVKLVFCGRIGQRKGVFDLIQAFAQLPVATQARAELVLAGDGEIAKGQALADSLGLASSVTFLGWIDADQRDQLLTAADVFILPSYNEGLPLALLEAMGWGLPVITTPISGIPDVVFDRKNGLLVNPGAVQDLSAAMRSLIEDEDCRLLLGKAARESVASLDIAIFYEKLLRIYALALPHSIGESKLNYPIGKLDEG